MEKVELAALLLTAMMGTQGGHAEPAPLHVNVTVQQSKQQHSPMASHGAEFRSHVNVPRDGSLEDAKKAIANQIHANANKVVLSEKGHPFDHARWVSWVRKARQPGAHPSLDVAVRK